MFSRHLLPIVGRIFFRCCGIFCFVCIVLLFVDISLIFLLSPVLSGLFPQIVPLFLLVLPFPFCFNIFQRLFVLLFWPFFVDLLSAFPVEFPILVLIFFFRAFWGDPNLVYFIRFRLYCSPFYVLLMIVVFSQFIILSKFSWFTFCPWDSVSLRLLGCALFGCVTLPFSKDGSSFLWRCFCLTTLDVSGTILLPCWLFIFWCISSISRSENQPFLLLI